MEKSIKPKKDFWFPHIINKRKKIVFIHVQNHISAMGVETMMRNIYPGYESKLVSDKELKILQGFYKKI